MNTFDLSTLDLSGPSEVATELKLRNPATDVVLTYKDADGNDQPVTISLLGLESGIAKRLKRKFQARRLEKLDKGKRMRLSPEQLEEERLDLYVALTQGWKGISWKQQPLEFTAPNARMLYQTLDWLQEQVQEHVGDLSNYLGNSEDGSSDTPGTSSGSTSE